MATAEPKRPAAGKRAAPLKEKLSSAPDTKVGEDQLRRGRGPASACSEPVGAAKDAKVAERYPYGMPPFGYQLQQGPDGTAFNPKEFEEYVKQHATRTKVKTETKDDRPNKDEKKDKKDKPSKDGGRDKKKKQNDEGPPDDAPDWGGDDDDGPGDEPDPEDDSQYTYEEESEEEEELEQDRSVEVTPRSMPEPAPPPAGAGARRGPRPRRQQQPQEEPRGTHHVGGAPRRRRPQGSHGGSNPPSLPSRGSATPASSRRTETIRTESVRQLLRDRPDQPEARARANLGQVRLETFSGDRAQYRNWMKTIQAQKQLYQIQDKELAVLLFLSCTGEAREVLNQLEVSDMQEEGGLQRILRLLEDAYGSKADERFEEKQSAFLNYRRSAGQSIAAYLATLKRLRNEYLQEDTGSTISDRAFAQRMLTRAALTRRERYDCFFAAGGAYRSAPIEKVLRFRCANVHIEERPETRRQEGYPRASRPPPKRRTFKRSDRRTPHRATRHAHVADEDDGYDEDEDFDQATDEEDLEQEALMAEEEMPEEEDWSYYEDDAENEEVEAVDQAALQEAFAAGWRAKDKTAQARQNRGYRDSGKPQKGRGKGKRPDSRKPDDRKRNSTCASCGQKGHWRGDAICPNVQSGKDAPHRKESSTHYTTASGSGKGSALQPKRGSAPSPDRADDRPPLQRRPGSASREEGQAGTTPKCPPTPPPKKKDEVDKTPMETYVTPTPKAKREKPPAPPHPPPGRAKEEIERSPSRKEPELEPKASPGEKPKKRRRRSAGDKDKDKDRHRRSAGEHRSDRDRTRERRRAKDEGEATPASTPREGAEEAFVSQPSTGTTARQCNWTYMVGGWDVIKDYDSDGSNTVSSQELESESDLDDLVRKYQFQNTPAPKSAARQKLKVKLMTVLKSLTEEEQDEEIKRRLQKKQDRLRDKITAKAVRSQASGSEAPARTRPKQETRDPKLDEDMGLSSEELLRILPNMSKEEKKMLYKQLKKEREEDALKLFEKDPPATASTKLKRPDRRRDGYSAATMPTSSTGRSLRKDEVEEPPDQEEKIPVGVKKKRMEKFRRQLYEAARNRKGKIVPSEASDLPNADQEQCSHPYERLLWGANLHAHWANCKDCKLRKVLYYSVMHGAMTSDQCSHALNQEHEAYQANVLAPGHVILDTGCRTAVAGRKWHEALQSLMLKKGLPFHKTNHEEVYRFGAGAPVLSTEAFLYAVQIYDHKSWVRIAVVDNTPDDNRVAECPGLVGPAELARWKVQIDFAKLQVAIHGKWQPTVLSPSRHPILNLLNVGKHPNPSAWETGDLRELRLRLTNDPHSFALLQEALDDLSSDDGCAAEPDPTTNEAVHWTGPQFEMMARWQKKSESETINLLDVMGVDCFRATTSKDDDDTSTGSISERESETSHEGGLPLNSSEEETTETEDDMTDEVMIAGSAGDTEYLGKGQKRRLLAAAKNISEAVETERNIFKKEKEVPRVRRLRTGYKILEIFTWSCMLSRFAYGLGWEYLEPVTLPGWDLTDPKVQYEAHQYIDRVDPDFIMLAWPCGPWSPLQRLNQKTWTQREALKHKQNTSKKLLKFSAQVSLKRQRNGRAILGENPLPSLAWKQEDIIDGFGGLAEGICDQCQYGLRHPENKMPLKKATRFVGQEEIVAELRKRCNGEHEHFPIEGSVRTEEYGTISLSSWAGGYPIPLCKAIMRGALSFLHRPAAPGKEIYVLEEFVAEESFQDGAEGIEEEEQRIAQENKRKTEELEEDERRPIPREVQKAVEHAHRQLGHPSRDTLVRMLRVSGATDEAVRHARRWQCDVCRAQKPPAHPLATTPTLRPYGFNRKLHLDIKFVHDSRERKYPCLSIVDLGTAYHGACLCKTRRSDYVARKFLIHWVQIFGAPEHIHHDQGGEFELAFVSLLEDMAIPTTVTGSHAPWQLSVGERHGAILGTMVSAITAEHATEGFTAMKLVLSSAVAAKNMTVTRDGFTPNQRLFGAEVKFPSLTEENVKPSFAEALDAESEYARAHKMRITARLALIRMDVQEKMRRAILRKPAHENEGPFVPGTQIYFWTPKRLTKRYARGGQWRGPATILVREAKERYFVSWRGRALLLAAPNIRLATREELALNEPAKEDADSLGELLRDPMREKVYKDQTRLAPPKRVKRRPPTEENPERKRARMMLRGIKSIRELLKDRLADLRSQVRKRRMPKQVEDQPAAPQPKKRAKALEDGSVHPDAPSIPGPPAALPGPGDGNESDGYTATSPYDEGEGPPQPPTDEELPHIPSDDEGLDEPSRVEAEPPTEVPPHEVPVPPDDEEEWLEEFRKLSEEDRRKMALDDVPLTLKRKQVPVDPAQAEAAVKKLRANFCAQVAATMVYGSLQNEWVSRYEVEILKQLTGLPVTAARIHRTPRKRFQKRPKMVSRSRLSILIGKDPANTFIVNEDEADVKQNPRRRASFLWKGMTIFYKTAKEDEKEPIYIQLPDGLYRADMTAQDAQDFEALWTEEVRDLLTTEALLLKMKQGGKELDPSYFDKKEKAAFDAADVKEWSEWIKNGVIERVSPAEAARIPKASIFRAPLRMLRVNKQTNQLLPLVAKSRLIVPGHLDPQLGEFRTDSPTCPQAAVRAAKSVAAARGWGGTIFDVTTAFLSGKHLQRQVYIRAPREGLPPAEGWTAVEPGELLRILKSAYGLTESPRLWYLEALDRIKKTELQELEMSRSTFVAGGGNSGSATYAILCLHVDDGLLLGDLQDKRVQNLKRQIDGMFKIKAWKNLSAKEPVQFLGVDVTMDSNGIHDDMKQYINQIKVELLQGSGPLNPRELTLYRQLIMRLRWPAQQAMPHMLYEVSALAQRVSRAQHSDYKEAVKLHGKFKEEASQGRARLTYPKIEEKEKMFYISFFDASVGKEEDGKSQLGSIHFLTTEKARTGPALASVVEFSTNKSSRVLRSSMSAESCSMSICVDRHLYGRLVLDRLLYGNRPLDADWRVTMGLDGGVVTDAKSLFDHLNTTGQLPTERQTMLDLLVARHHLEAGAYMLFWVPTHRQHADGLTKKMVNLLWQAFCKVPKISLKETPEEKSLEDHRRRLRQGQRQRRKLKMKGRALPPAAPGINSNTPTRFPSDVKKHGR
ncbi:unnamed protein product [Cladocopium goreaui]|uniref:Retrovirus-related Pol polyprotein from transposon RE1 (Retro element 1) (AtRE1) n=1 Tax=Cladocopium goreaui TaxID=2562237 RepID=A0A9P1D4L6_9DINO|nr:unnamed protein product [Cladocopium goreaui]